MKLIILNTMTLIFSVGVSASQPTARQTWKSGTNEKFSDAEANFKFAMESLLENYIDNSLTKDDLYRAATAGMLASLNVGDENWNQLLSPSELKEMQVEMSGKVSGIGIGMKFQEDTGYAYIFRIVPGSASEKAGLKAGDQILSVDGKKFKGKTFDEMVFAIRGEIGKSVALKVLREDQILNFAIKREIIPWTPAELEKIDSSTALLSIRFFNSETPKAVEKMIADINAGPVKNLILDLRDNSGGGFEQAVKVAELFVPKNVLIARTKNRTGKAEQFHSSKGILKSSVRIAVLTNKETFSGAELVTAALKENLKSKIIGEPTFGKWSAQMVEELPNKFAIKYTIKEFLSPEGNSFQGVGIKPDLEVHLPENVLADDLRVKYGIKDRIPRDSQLKAALEMLNAL